MAQIVLTNRKLVLLNILQDVFVRAAGELGLGVLRTKTGAHCHCQFDGRRAAVLMLLSAEMTLPAVYSVICEGIAIAIIRSDLAAFAVVAAAIAIIGQVGGRGSKSVIFGSHHFVHRRSRFARGDLGRATTGSWLLLVTLTGAICIGGVLLTELLRVCMRRIAGVTIPPFSSKSTSSSRATFLVLA
jgi:hypothetical protein